MYSTPIEEARALLKLADVFFDVEDGDGDPKWAQMLNLNDTFCWGCADCEYVSDQDLPEVARLFHRYGWCGVLFWVNRKRNWEVIEFADIKRFVEFVAHEEAIRAEKPDSNARAYHKKSYTLGATPSAPHPTRWQRMGATVAGWFRSDQNPAS